MSTHTLLDLARRISREGISGFVVVDLCPASRESLIPHLPHMATSLVVGEAAAIEFAAGQAQAAYVEIVETCIRNRGSLRGRVVLAEDGRTEITTFE